MPEPIDPTIAVALSTATLSSTLLTPVLADPTVRLATVQAVDQRFMNLAVLHNLTVIDQVANAPLVSTAPSAVDRAIAGTDGTTYYLPRARVAERSKATHAPYVFLERREGSVHLQVWFDLTIPDADATALPVDGYRVALVGAAGRIDFGRCDELPPTDKPAGVVGQLFCEAPLTTEQTNQVVGTMQTDTTARFEVTATVHYSLADAGGSTEPIRILPIQVQPIQLQPIPVPPTEVRSRRGKPAAPATLGRLDRLKLSSTRLLTSVVDRLPLRDPAPTSGTSTQHHTSMPLTPDDHAGTRAHFPPEVPHNRPIYAQVTTGFGTEPWARWVPLQHGRFVESPVPEQFFVLPDEYRLALDRETGRPAMMVLLIPPDRPTDDTAPATFGGDYKIRCRFSVVPWYDPQRLDALRQEIVDHTGVHYPQLHGGGFRSATCALSRTYQSLGSSLVGDGESAIEVDALGFDLVIDSTSEFYTLLSRLMVSDGVGGEVTIELIADAEQPETATVPVMLRLDRPALDVLSAELLPPADPEHTSPRMRVSNPIPYAVTVASVAAKLLVVDETLPTPIGAVPASADPASFTIPAGTSSEPATLEIDLTAQVTDLPSLYGGVGVDFIGASVDIDADKVLTQAHEVGASGDLSSTVEVRSYQLEHPDVLPATHADVFGIELQLRRGDAEPITVFLTRDQPATTVQVSFTLADVLAGARPEQPKFSWRRRNLAGAGTGEWSEWESIVGRQLFVSPTGL